MNRLILRLAIPNILSNLTVPLLGMVDTALMGRLDSPYYLGAVALGSLVLNFIYWGMGFLRMGTTGMTAQAYGQGDAPAQIHLLGRALLVAGSAALLILLLQRPIAWLGFALIPGEAEVLELARSYFFIRVWAAPATIGLYALQGWFLGMQNARFPLFLTLLINLANVGLNLWLVLGEGLQSDGVALATVMAQYLGLLAALGLFWLRYRGLLAHLHWQALVQRAALARFFSVNADIFVRTLCLIFTFSFFTAQSSGVDPLVLAANQILLQYFYTMSFGVDGFAFAAESLVGRFTGEGHQARLRAVLGRLFLWGGGLGIAFALLYALAGGPLLRLFTDQPEVIAAAQPYLGWMSGLAIAGAVAFLWDGAYIGATAVRPMRNTMLLATFGVFLPAFYLAFPHLGNHGLWLAMLLFMLARSVLLTVLAKRYVWG
ncbi:MAG: MATE family efflux transporter [Bacteroidetes bacterium]|nr:MAG: MATE family efflux transporter [Bacteroidota bacterium]